MNKIDEVNVQSKINRLFSTSAKGQILAPLGLVALIIYFSFASQYFLSLDNGITIIRQASINIVLAVGMTLVIITAGIDLSVGAILALSACSMSQLHHLFGLDIWTAAIVGIIIGALLGFMNGIIIHYAKITPFIATLGTMGIARGLALIITRGTAAPGFPESFRQMGSGTLFGIPILFIIAFVFLLIGLFILKYTELGRNIYAIGGNEEAARLSGINVARTKVFAYTFAGLAAGIGAVMLAARVNSAPPVAGQGFELDAIAAVVIGGASLMGGEGSIWGTLLGAIIMAVLANGLNLLNADPYVQMAIIGAVIILAVFMKNLSDMRQN